MNRQDIFDKVATHLLTQRARSWNKNIGEEGGCAYRGDNGMKCAVGCLIPDSMYTSAMENSRIGYLARNYPEIGELFGIKPNNDGDRDLALLASLQSSHDHHNPKNWKSELASVADEFGLDKTVLNDFDRPAPFGTAL